MKKTEFIKPEECNLGDNWIDYYIEMNSIKRGDTFYECNGGKNIKLKAVSDAKKNDYGWVCVVENLEGSVVELFVSADTKYNGVNLFRAPLYLEYDEKKGYIYPII